MLNKEASYRSGWLFLLVFLFPAPIFSQINEGEFFSDEPSPLTMLRADFDRTWGHESRFLRNDLAMLYDNTKNPAYLNFLLQWHLEEFCEAGPNRELEELYKIIWERGARPLALNDKVRCSLQQSESLIADTTLLNSLIELGLQTDFLIDEGFRQHFPGNLIHSPEDWPTIKWAIKHKVAIHHPYRFDPLDLTFMPLFQQACLINAHELIDWMLKYDRSLAYYPSIRYHGSEHRYFASPASLVIKSFNGENEQEILHTLQLLKNAEIDVLVEDYRGKSPLDYAMASGQTEILRFMVSWEKEARSSCKKGLKKEILRTMKGLQGPELDSLLIDTDFGKATVLTLAVAMQDEPLVKKLIRQGANPMKQWGRGHPLLGQTPVIHALLSGNESLVMTILSDLPSETEEEQWWVNEALKKTVSVPMIQFYDYYDNPHSPDSYEYRPTQFLLNRGAEADLPLFIIKNCEKSNPRQLAFWLSQPGVDLSGKEYIDAITSAIQYGGISSDSCAALMIKAGIDPRHYIDWRGESLFTMACRHVRPLTLAISLSLYPELVEADMWLGRKDSLGYRNPLNIVINTLPAATFAGRALAAENFSEEKLSKHIESIQILLRYGADPDREDITGITPRENVRARTHLSEAILEVFDD